MPFLRQDTSVCAGCCYDVGGVCTVRRHHISWAAAVHSVMPPASHQRHCRLAKPRLPVFILLYFHMYVACLSWGDVMV
jgi:hypothetical protein